MPWHAQGACTEAPSRPCCPFCIQNSCQASLAEAAGEPGGHDVLKGGRVAGYSITFFGTLLQQQTGRRALQADETSQQKATHAHLYAQAPLVMVHSHVTARGLQAAHGVENMDGPPANAMLQSAAALLRNASPKATSSEQLPTWKA